MGPWGGNAITKGRRIGALATAGLLAATATAAHGQASGLAGRWLGEARVSGAQIPFRLDFTARAGRVQASFFNGSRPTNPSAPAWLSSGQLHLAFPAYGSSLDATVIDGALEGTYTRDGIATPITARKGGALPAPAANAPSVAGEWIVQGVDAKGEKAWRLLVRQAGSRAEASLLRIDGDSGVLNGVYAGGVFRLSHFAGERPALLEIRPDGQKLRLSYTDAKGRLALVALRPRSALAQGPVPLNPRRFTGVADPAGPFRFAFRDLSGHVVANTDRRFRGKVVLVDVMGSWCPNCHDEAPFLQALYASRHARGLEVVALDFEQTPDQVADPQRLRIFIQRYGLTYPVLLAGQTKAVHEKLPQATNLAAWPTTFFIGRDGRVKAVHVGFTSAADGVHDRETRAGIEKLVDGLLAARG